MTYKAKVAVCSEILTKQSTQNEQHVDWWNLKKALSFEILNKSSIYDFIKVAAHISTCFDITVRGQNSALCG
jgi:response regulator RpfG family c-di-GMP phosphodiesterase